MATRASERRFQHAKLPFGCRLQDRLPVSQHIPSGKMADGSGKIVIAGLENIANEIGCSKKTLYKWIRQRRFPAFKMDGVWRAMRKDIEAWFDGIRHHGPDQRL